MSSGALPTRKGDGAVALKGKGKEKERKGKEKKRKGKEREGRKERKAGGIRLAQLRWFYVE